MRGLFRFLFTLCFAFLLIGEVDADSAISDLKLECNSTVGYNTTFDCNLYGKVSNSRDLSSLEVTDITNSRMFKTTNLINYDVSRMSGTLKLATYTGKTFTTSGKASIGLRVAYNDIYFKYVTYRIRIVDKNTDLSSITIDGNKLETFNKNKTSYNITTGKDSVIIGAVAYSKNSEITGTETKKLSCGKNTSKIVVTAESGDKKTYNLNINKDCDLANEVVLSSLKASKGNLSPKFDSKVTEYKLVVDQNTDKITLEGIAKNGLTVKGNVKDKEILPGLNRVIISVNSSDNVKKEYIINVIRQKDDAYLSSLSLSSGAFNFDRKTFLYETTVVYDTLNVDVRAVPEQQNAKVEITGGKDLKVGENLISIKVTSETESVNTYKIKLIRLKEDQTIGDNPYIKDIKIKNYDINFDPNIVNYSLKIKNEKKLDIIVEVDDESTSYEILGNKNLKDGSVITIKSTSSGGFVKLYKIKISKSNNTFYYIISLIVIALIVGLLITLIIINKKQNRFKFPLISSSLLSSNKEKIKTDNISFEKEENKKDINIEVENNQMVKCPKCGFSVPSQISECPNCRLKL